MGILVRGYSNRNTVESLLGNMGMNETTESNDTMYPLGPAPTTHERFNRKVWTFKSDLTSALAKCLVSQSPYTVPDNLSICIEKFDTQLDSTFSFDSVGMVHLDLSTLTTTINAMLESVPEIMALNERKNGREGIGYTDRYYPELEPDDDFICIMAVAQNITCEFADKADASCWLESNRDS